MMHASITLDKAYAIGRIDPRIYGSFVEHMGRTVYGGIYEPGHPTADAQGFRQDVLEKVRNLGVTTVRYPGGNFVSGFNWEDSVGPNRPKRLDLAWIVHRDQRSGPARILRLVPQGAISPPCIASTWVPAVRSRRGMWWSTPTIPAAASFRTCALPTGKRDPLNIHLWCLGNEMDGPWQIGRKTARGICPHRQRIRQADEVGRPFH